MGRALRENWAEKVRQARIEGCPFVFLLSDSHFGNNHTYEKHTRDDMSRSSLRAQTILLLQSQSDGGTLHNGAACRHARPCLGNAHGGIKRSQADRTAAEKNHYVSAGVMQTT